MRDLNRIMRPKSWDDVVGQNEVKEICQKALAENRFPKFSIFYGPTGVGKSCMAELIASELVQCTGEIDECPAIKKYNMAALIGKKDIVEIIDSIFKFKTVAGTCVYILEEVQVLKQKEEQTPFLEELTKIPDNVYIMMCTTRITALTPEMRNRAVAFQLSLPSMSDCEQLVINTLEKMHFSAMTPKAMSILIKSSDFTPRSIIKHIELLATENCVREEEINKFFKIISNEVYIRTLASLIDSSIKLYDFVNQMSSALSDKNSQNFMYGLRDFTLQYIIERASGKNQLTISVADRKLCNELLKNLDENMFARLFDSMSHLDTYKFESDKDVLVYLIKMKLMLSQISPAAIMKNKASNAAEAFIANKRASKSIQRPAPASEELVEITSSSNLAALGMEDDTIYDE